MKRTGLLRRVGAALLATYGLVSLAQTGDAGARLGQVQFKVECNEAAQSEFNIAMAYYHSFAWEHYQAPLQRALAADSGCGMAHWLHALALLDNPFGWPTNLSPARLDQGAALLEQARKTGLRSERERDYVDALAAFFKGRDVLAHRARAQAFEDAMAKVAERYPQDIEATILYALIVSVNFDPTDKQYKNQLKAARLLEPIFEAKPQHPGVAHYLIHSYDYPPIAAQGLKAAQRYAKIAPDATHALHMPSHIFTRVGDWAASVQSNRASAESARASIPNRLHAYDYMVYAHLQLGQEQAAAQVLGQLRAAPMTSDNFAAAYAIAAMPARYALERGAWKDAATLPLNVAAEYPFWSKYPHAEAVNAYARGVGAAMIGDVTAAGVEAARLGMLRDDAAAAKFGYWVEQIDIQSEVVQALAMIASGQQIEGLARLRKAAEREDATEKHVVTPGPVAPARELLAYALLGGGAAAEALREFETVMTKEPNRYRTLAGAARAARQASVHDKARSYAARLLDLAAGADSVRVELADAKSYLGR